MSFNVLQLVGSFHQGGSERQALQLARLLAAGARCRVHVASLDPTGALRADAESITGGDDIPSFPLTSFYDANAARQLRRFARLLREREIDVVHTHDFYSNVFGMAGATLARTSARVASKRETTGMRTRAQAAVQRAAFSLADAVVVNSEAVRRDLERAGVAPKKIVTVYNGLDPRRVSPPAGLAREEALAAFDLPADEGLRFVTIVANLRHEVKDHPTFLRAARRVAERVPAARFVVAGEGELVGQTRSLAASLGLAEKVFFTGRCSRVAELLFASDVCVLSSKAEGFSNAILEYMAAARPVVATDVGGAREAIIEGETGHVVAAGDDRALAERIVSLLEDDERARRMGERGRERVAEKFSCAAQSERTLALYERLLAPRRRAEHGVLAEGGAREG
ncbi:MAG: glycosyltransferase [Acidobacteriota bacterium]|nr:glycosyltransferase [Acidobacteriota bacterium]